MQTVKKLVKRSAVRAAFHGREARVPRGFFEDLEMDVQVAIRRYLEEGEEALPIAEEAPEALLVRRSAVKDAIRQGGRRRVDGGIVARLSAVVEAKVAKAIDGASPLPKMFSSPGRVWSTFIRSAEHRAGMTRVLLGAAAGLDVCRARRDVLLEREGSRARHEEGGPAARRARLDEVGQGTDGAGMRSAFGWSLPPGCGRLPGEEPEVVQLRCKCGAFLPTKPDRTEPWEEATDCDGKISSAECEYSEDEVRILGEFRGRKFMVYRASCGEEVGGQDAKHAPHREIIAGGTHSFYTCRNCGAETKVTE
jgi:hypothetical protein